MKATSKRRVGMALIIVSIVGLVMILPAYAIASFVISQILVTTESANAGVIASIVRLLLGFTPVLSVIGIVVGIVMMRKAGPDIKAGEHLKEQPGFGHLSPEHATFLTGWSLGAFLNPIIWAFGNKLWPWALSLLAPIVIFPLLGVLFSFGMFIPAILIALVMFGWSFFATIYLIVRGRRLAWKRGWPSFEQFQKRQSLMLKIILIVAAVATILSAVIGAMSRPNEDLDSGIDSQPTSDFNVCAQYADVDHDYLTARDEQKFNTDPNKADTDDDGYDDLTELLSGNNPGSFDPNVLSAKPIVSGDTLEEKRASWIANFEAKQDRCN